jgi:hypothetical protein
MELIDAQSYPVFEKIITVPKTVIVVQVAKLMPKWLA